MPHVLVQKVHTLFIGLLLRHTYVKNKYTGEIIFQTNGIIQPKTTEKYENKQFTKNRHNPSKIINFECRTPQIQNIGTTIYCRTKVFFSDMYISTTTRGTHISNLLTRLLFTMVHIIINWVTHFSTKLHTICTKTITASKTMHK